MDYYICLILGVFYQWFFKLANIIIALSLLAFMDFINFQRPKDQGYFSLHTKGSKRDAWHDSKKLAILFFAIAAIGEAQVAWLINNPLIWVALFAWFLQAFIYKGLKTIKRIFRKS
jgi:hypothetical protein